MRSEGAVRSEGVVRNEGVVRSENVGIVSVKGGREQSLFRSMIVGEDVMQGDTEIEK